MTEVVTEVTKVAEVKTTYKTNYNKQYYERNKEKLLQYNRENQQKKYENEEERNKILERNRKRYDERKRIVEAVMNAIKKI
jgi:hypothetical protein